MLLAINEQQHLLIANLFLFSFVVFVIYLLSSRAGFFFYFSKINFLHAFNNKRRIIQIHIVLLVSTYSTTLQVDGSTIKWTNLLLKQIDLSSPYGRYAHKVDGSTIKQTTISPSNRWVYYQVDYYQSIKWMGFYYYVDYCQSIKWTGLVLSRPLLQSL